MELDPFKNQGPGEQHLAGVGDLGFCNASDLAADLLVEYQGQWRGTPKISW